MIIGLVGCASQKLKRPALARELYVSTLFRKASAHAEANSDVWYILSAKHGLLNPDQIVEPYDVKLGTKAAGPIHAWGQRVRDQLEFRHPDEDIELLALAGGQYIYAFYNGPWKVSDPLKGMGIGQRLAWLTNN